MRRLHGVTVCSVMRFRWMDNVRHAYAPVPRPVPTLSTLTSSLLSYRSAVASTNLAHQAGRTRTFVSGTSLTRKNASSVLTKRFPSCTALSMSCVRRPTTVGPSTSSTSVRRRYAIGDNDSQRSSSSRSSSSSTNKAFDRNFKLSQRNNAARARKSWRGRDPTTSLDKSDGDDPVDYEYFRKEMALRLVDRLDDIRRDEGFPLTLEIGAGVGHVYRAICSDDGFEFDEDEGEGDGTAAGNAGGIGGVRKMVLLDSSDAMLHVDDDIPVEGSHRCEAYKLVADEESKLPFPDGTFDLVLSSQALHWINDLPEVFREVHRVLKPDGCFMFSMIGGATLPELRISLSLAELERDGGVGAHVGPFVELSDVGSLMQNAGFALPTIDVDTVKISYPNAAVLMEHLQRMGEGNASLRRRQDPTGKDVFLAAACIYDELYPLDDGGNTLDIEASVQVIFAIGWTPHASQQKPSKRGSATRRVGEIVTQTKADSE